MSQQQTAIYVDAERLRGSIEQLSDIGAAPDGGIYRMGFTEADMRGRRWLMEQLESSGLTARMDEAGNVIGGLPDAPDAPAVLIGSHPDTVPGGGQFDGALGVVVGLECLRRIHEAGDTIERPVELIAFADEEGRFGGMFGSSAFAGELTPADVNDAVALDGVTLESALRACGLDPRRVFEARRPPESVDCYVELHIEQGPVLDRLGLRSGLVTNIVGLFKWVVRLIGEADHAGTTPMRMRRDAFGGLAEFAGEIPRIIEEEGSPDSVVSIGRVELRPGSANTVPAVAEFSLDVRDPDAETLDSLGRAIRKAISAIGRRRKLMFEYDCLSEIAPVSCDQRVIDAVRGASEALEIEPHEMPSGAAHDAQMIAKIAPIGMLFAPSKGGRSHSPAEWTHFEDIELNANIALGTLQRLAGSR